MNMNVDYIIIGQGICGTWLSYYLMKEGKTVLVIDDNVPDSSSKVASGIINPVTGRRVVATWMIDDLLPYVLEAYSEFGILLNEEVILQKNIIAFPGAMDMKEAYDKRIMDENSFIKPIFLEKENELKNIFNFMYGCFEINPGYLINLHYLLSKWRKQLEINNALLEENFDESNLIVKENLIHYKYITAQKIIYCNGTEAYKSPFWQKMPATFVKGQALIVELNNLPTDKIYKIGAVTITPWYNDLWWIGSSYENEFYDAKPTEIFKKQKLKEMEMFLKIDIKFIDHISSIRPASVERRPFAGIHPKYPNIGLLNGMGTKGCSLAPWFANQFANHLVSKNEIDPLADLKRFTGLLSR